MNGILKRVIVVCGVIASLVGIVTLVDIVAFDKEVEAGLKAQQRRTDGEYYARRIGEAEMRVELYCVIKDSLQECEYWTRQLRRAKDEREKFLRL